MDDLKIIKINQKVADINKKINYLNGIVLDESLKEYAETYQIQNIFQIDSSLDMIQLSLDELIQNIEHFDYCGISSNYFFYW